ncbi:MAG TPA: cell wall-binding repeat-containing protein [Candidatus Limnocylindria bacterium]|nr:cell wall-binding repeat-containing protein [Candidatus Limnocylindria bacterium]
MPARTLRSLRLPFVAFVAAMVAAVTIATGTSNAVAVTAGYRDFQYQPASTTNTFRATADKPQSKVWYAGGSWWGGLFHLPAGGGNGEYEIYQLNTSTQTWTTTGVKIDERNKSHGDYLFDGANNKLWVVSTDDSASTPGVHVFRYTFASGTYTADAGFPILTGVTIDAGAAESATIARDSTGRMWVTYTLPNANTARDDVWIASSTDGLTWSNQVLPSQGSSPAADDISAVIAFAPNKIGVMWSDQVADGNGETGFWFSTHTDGDPTGTWSTREKVAWGKTIANDHMNLKTLNGVVYAALKTMTDQSEEYVTYLAARSATGAWSTHGVTLRDVAGVDNNQTRPQIAIDTANSRIYFFAAESENGGVVYYKWAPLSTLTFPAGKGTALMQSSSDTAINDPSTSKQNPSATTGMLVVGSDRKSGYYLHSFTSLSSPPPTATPSATAKPTATATPKPSATATPKPTATATPTTKPTVVRYSGANRYATAASVSFNRYKTVPVPVVYIATGTGFADALSAGPAAAKEGGPVLLVAPTGIPTETASELTRLKPKKIVVVGGTGVVSDKIKSDLAKYSSVVVRRAGADRYSTSATISSTTFSTIPVPVVYVATGVNFPDALAGVPAAGRQHGPILLTTKDDVPTVIMAELKRLKPARIVVLGGTGVVSGTAVNELKTVTANVTRLAGTDRWSTAVAVSKAVFPTGAKVVYVANGLNFPDALAGGPPASVQGAPLLLVTKDTIPAATSTEIKRLGAKTVVILGGTGVVSTNVQSQLLKLIGG